MKTKIIMTLALATIVAGGVYLKVTDQQADHETPVSSAQIKTTDSLPTNSLNNAQEANGKPDGAQNSPSKSANILHQNFKIFIKPTDMQGGRVFAKIDETIAVKLTNEESVNQFITSQAAALGMGAQDKLLHKSTTQDELGNNYYKFSQNYQDLPVFGQELVVQVGPSGDPLLVAGNFESSINLSTSPTLEGSNAVLGALSQGTQEDAPIGPVAMLEAPKLTVYIDGNTPPILTYRAVVDYTSNSGQHKDQVFVDANTGNMVATIPMLHTAFTEKLYTLNQKCITGSTDLPGTAVAAGTDAHTRGADKNTTMTYWFYKNFLNRDSIDNKGLLMKASVHAKFQGSTGTCDGQNAFFDNTSMGVVFGEGSADMNTPPAAPDVVAHEFTHGVTFKTSNLTYKNESGALNEGMSDIFGSTAEAWAASGGTSTGNPSGGIVPNSNTWIVGDAMAAASNIKFKRFMNNPTKDGNSKDNYTERYTGTGDNGGVHINSGILNLAYYLLAQGGTHPRSSVSTVNVPAIGIEKAMKLYYHSNSNLFTASTNFASARNLLAQSAETLYGKCSAEYKSVQLSFDAVKVGGTWSCSGTTPTPTPTPTPAPTPSPTPTNLLTGSALVASSSYSSSYLPAKMLDGNMNTAWVSQMTFGAPEIVQIDMKSVKKVTSFTINWSGNNIPRHFTVGAYINNVWVPLQNIWNALPVASQTVTLNTSTRYLVITMDSGSFSNFYYGISEISAK